jgi:hypothetical protein
MQFGGEELIKISVKNPLKGKDHLENTCIDKKYCRLSAKKKGQMVSSYEHSNEPSVSMEKEGFLDCLDGYY